MSEKKKPRSSDPSSKDPAGNSQTSHLKKKETYKAALLKEPWLAAFRKSGTILAASQMVPVSRRTVQDWRKDDPVFEAKFKEALLERGERLITTMWQRAVNGNKRRPVTDEKGNAVLDSNGKPVVDIDYDTTLQIFLAKGEFPELYAERTKVSFDEKFFDDIASVLLSIINRHVFDFCPHCKTALEMRPKIAEELRMASARMGGDQ